MLWFHAHIYFKDIDFIEASKLLHDAKKFHYFRSVNISKIAIGPHPSGMIELQFNENNYSLSVKWIEMHRGNFSALIHHDTGNDIPDHSENILWLGEPLPLNFSFFELIKDRPDLQIHK